MISHNEHPVLKSRVAFSLVYGVPEEDFRRSGSEQQAKTANEQREDRVGMLYPHRPIGPLIGTWPGL